MSRARIKGIDPLLQFFGEYQAALNRCVDALRGEGSLQDLFGTDEPLGDASGARLAELTHRFLRRQLMDSYEFHTRMSPASSQDSFREVLYLAAAVTDETLLFGTQWGGRDHWLGQLLEKALFGSSSAGEKVFSRIQDLLDQQDPSPPKMQLARIYLLVLALNFRGRYRPLPKGEQEDGSLAQWRAQLALFVELPARDAASAMCPDAYRFSSGIRRLRLAPLSRWHNYMATAFLALLMMSLVAELYASWPIINFMRAYGGVD